MNTLKVFQLFQAKKDNTYGNLRSFSYEVNKLVNLPKNYVFSGWEEAFDTILDYAKDKRFVLAIDEYPYIVEQDGSFPSILQEFVDRAGRIYLFWFLEVTFYS